MKLTLRIPPLLLFVVIVLAMWLGRGEGRAAPLWLVLVATLWLAGALLGGGALLHFWLQRTTVHPQRLESSRVLVTRGVYRISRNPMYLGLLCWTCCSGAGLPASRSWRRSRRCGDNSAMPMTTIADRSGAGAEARRAPSGI